MLKADQWFPGGGVGAGKEQKRQTAKGQEKFWEGCGYVHDLDYGGDFIGVYVCQNLINCTL